MRGDAGRRTMRASGRTIEFPRGWSAEESRHVSSTRMVVLVFDQHDPLARTKSGAGGDLLGRGAERRTPLAAAACGPAFDVRHGAGHGATCRNLLALRMELAGQAAGERVAASARRDRNALFVAHDRICGSAA